MVQRYYDNTGSYVIAIILFFIFMILFVRELRNMTNSTPNIFEPIENENVVHVDTNENVYNDIINDIDESETTPQPEKQVFNLSENIYTYHDAKLACKSMGAELASLDNLVEAYKKGANWCNYGWSKDKLALYPIQKKSWNKIQSDPNKRNSCGYPGINGGYFKDENYLFGANCYGVKPRPKEGELEQSSIINNDNYNTEKLYNYTKDIPKVAPFSGTKWSKFN